MYTNEQYNCLKIPRVLLSQLRLTKSSGETVVLIRWVSIRPPRGCGKKLGTFGTAVLCHLAIWMGNCSWFTDGKHCFTDDESTQQPWWIIHENAPWSSAAKSMLPGNAKCSMTSLADTKNIYSWKDWWCIQFCSWLRPRAVSRLRALDEIIKSLSFARNNYFTGYI